MFGGPIWILEVAYSSLQSVTLPHILGGSKTGIFCGIQNWRRLFNRFSLLYHLGNIGIQHTLQTWDVSNRQWSCLESLAAPPHKWITAIVEQASIIICNNYSLLEIAFDLLLGFSGNRMFDNWATELPYDLSYSSWTWCYLTHWVIKFGLHSKNPSSNGSDINEIGPSRSWGYKQVTWSCPKVYGSYSCYNGFCPQACTYILIGYALWLSADGGDDPKTKKN